MDIKTIAELVYLLVLFIYAAVMSINDIKLIDSIYWVPLVCIGVAYFCGLINGGAFG